jgi:hypothetical protein
MSAGITVKIDAYIFLEGLFELLPELDHKFGYPAVMFVIFSAVVDENVVLKSVDYAGHDPY